MNSIPVTNNNIQIDTGEIVLTINDDKKRVVAFNPNDISFTERFYNLTDSFEKKSIELSTKIEKLKENSDVDSFGIPTNTNEIIALNKEIFEYLRAQIDYVFGDGTSKTAFGSINSFEVFTQFIEGITPFVGAVRSEKMDKYRKQSDGLLGG